MFIPKRLLLCTALICSLSSTAYAGGGPSCDYADVTCEGAINIVDVQCIILTMVWDFSLANISPPKCLAEFASLDQLASVGSSIEDLADLDCNGSITIADIQVGVALAVGQPLSVQIDADGDQRHDACLPPCKTIEDCPDKGGSCLPYGACVFMADNEWGHCSITQVTCDDGNGCTEDCCDFETEQCKHELIDSDICDGTRWPPEPYCENGVAFSVLGPECVLEGEQESYTCDWLWSAEACVGGCNAQASACQGWNGPVFTLACHAGDEAICHFTANLGIELEPDAIGWAFSTAGKNIQQLLIPAKWLCNSSWNVFTYALPGVQPLFMGPEFGWVQLQPSGDVFTISSDDPVFEPWCNQCDICVNNICTSPLGPTCDADCAADVVLTPVNELKSSIAAGTQGAWIGSLYISSYVATVTIWQLTIDFLGDLPPDFNLENLFFISEGEVVTNVESVLQSGDSWTDLDLSVFTLPGGAGVLLELYADIPDGLSGTSFETVITIGGGTWCGDNLPTGGSVTLPEVTITEAFPE